MHGVFLETGIELDARAGGDIEVSLLWSPTSGRTWVDVRHIRSGECFSVEAPPAEALEVFRHPFAYGFQADDDE